MTSANFGVEYIGDLPREEGEILSVGMAQAALVKTSSFKYRVGKRCVDLLFCVLLLPVLLPVLLAVTLAVKLSSPGPIFYREQRVGKSGKTFTIFKFRSMYTKEYLRDVLGYSECDLTQLRRRLEGKQTHDCRITRVGRLLRRSSLDELPQLINVLRGDMSLVGPRPVVAAELHRYGFDAYFYKLAIPGLTGLWQVSGRNDVTYNERVKFDVRYCSEWKPSLDAKIMFQTIPAVFRAKGAY
jgi:exopolysaccharide production protein ExoY